ncbi:hypothetical protein CQA49_00955 [Helicobacter sp. MIT 00-7814]|uniref:hypothetical protein n=1 Tax=unclassified Helicobacter TaxID=2593540 RepID=UPI000E1F5460|nr:MULTISPECIES: hypothetical protein [unclassified Helicobacter]RDU55080.1 hypothetical protein CQA37_04545 [Helicobacter sp. MIT 99-10781]RDU56899.1 hypothetical protein CQA49_00955 [Helicobacter sp. MIT 00-7814]
MSARSGFLAKHFCAIFALIFLIPKTCALADDDAIFKEQKVGWQIDLKRISINFSSTTLRNQDIYSIAADTRLQGDSQIVAQGYLNLNMDYYTPNFVIFNSLLAEYGRTIIFPKNAPSVDNKTLDRILLSSDYTQRLWEFDSFLGFSSWYFELGPYSKLAYQTEFVASSTLGRRQIVRANIGVKLFSGLVLKDFALTLFGEKDFNPNIQAQSLGMELGMVYEKKFKNSGKLYYMLNARDYIFSTTSSAYDPKYSLEFELRYDLSLYKNLNIAPFMKVYALQGKYFDRSGSNVMLGMVFSFGKILREAPFEIVEK